MTKGRITSPGMLTSPKQKKPKTRKNRLIFVMGFKNTGKDTFAQMLIDCSYNTLKRVSFADILKTECYPLMSIDPKEYSQETDDREWKDAHRDEIIRYGEGQKQKNGRNYWIERALDPYLLPDPQPTKAEGYQDVIVTDCRRVEEVMWYKGFKLDHHTKYKHLNEIYEPILFVVHREGANDADKDYLTHIALEYAAETRAFDRMVKNYGTEEDLLRMAKDIWAIRVK